MAQPRIYDVVQTLVGAKKMRRRLAAQISQLIDPDLVLDLGGGTGSVGDYWPASTTYICLDIDMLKLVGFRRNNPGGVALLADATNTPIADKSLDAVVCTAVSHHLPDLLLPKMLKEVSRILKPTGQFLFLDAVWNPRRPVGRLIWHYDRGSHPRSAETLRSLIAEHLKITHWEQFAIHHEYALCVATPV